MFNLSVRKDFTHQLQNKLRQTPKSVLKTKLVNSESKDII